MNDTSDKKPLWSSTQGLLTVIATAITVIIGLLSIIYSFGVFDRKPARPIPAATSAPGGPAVTAPSAQPTNQPATLMDAQSPGAQGCLEAYFSDIPGSRVRVLEEGSKDVVLVGRDQSKEEAIGVKFTDAGQPIGALVFRVFADGKRFTVTSIVDGSCNKVEGSVVEGRPGEKWTLRNRDTLRVPFGGRHYDLRLGFTGGTISAVSFVRAAP